MELGQHVNVDVATQLIEILQENVSVITSQGTIKGVKQGGIKQKKQSVKSAKLNVVKST